MRISKFIKQSAFILLAIGIMLTGGCASKASRYDQIKNALQQKYVNKNFNIRGIDDTVYSGNKKYVALVSPENRPEYLFEVTMNGDQLEEDDYVNRLAAETISNRVIGPDIRAFFPGINTFTHTEVTMTEKKEIANYDNLTLIDLLANADNTRYTHVHIDIYYDEAYGSNGLYEEEYEYFTDTINEYIKRGFMFPLSVTFYKVNSKTIDNVMKYYVFDVRKNKQFYDSVFGKDVFQTGIANNGDTDLGTPPNVTVYFNDDSIYKIESKEEYIRIRQLLDNAP